MSHKAVVEGVLQHVSASQIRTFADCERRWALDKVFGEDVPATGATNEGQAAHGLFEDYWTGLELHELQFEVVPPVLGNSLAQLLMDPKLPHKARGTPGLFAEHPQDYNLAISIADVPVRGRIELLHLGLFSGEAQDDPVARVIDLKTTNKRSGIKSKAYLTTDIQLGIYGYWCFDNNPDLVAVTLTHAYALKEEVFAKVVDTPPLPRDHFAAVRDHLVPVVEQMQQVAEVSDWLDARPNYDCCMKYGPKYACPFFNKCHDAAGNRVAKPKVGKTMAELIAQNNPARATGINPPDAAPPPRVPVPAPTDALPPPADLFLYVDTDPVRLPVDARLVFLADEINRRQAIIAAKYGVADIRQAPFGKGTADLAASFRTEPLLGHVVARREGLAANVLEILVSQAKHVVGY